LPIGHCADPSLGYGPLTPTSAIMRAALAAALAAAPTTARAQAAPTTITGPTVSALAQAQILAGATLRRGQVSHHDTGEVLAYPDALPFSLASVSERVCDPPAASACRLRIIDLP
jgi:hypothetical protein